VTDFGLARVQSEAGLTLTGDLVGTLRYMSPEQALAKRGEIDHRTDVYSLGATLYELLTLRPAFPGTDREELLRQIAFEEPVPLRRLNRAVSMEMETIVLKALEKAPADRYATAQELADDLRRFLDSRPIRARRPSLVHRALKWARRHHAAVLSAGVVLLVACLALAAETLLLWREKERTRAALAQAEAKSRWASRAVDDMYTEVAEKWLADKPHMTEVERQFLQKALDFYEELSKERSTDPEVRLETAQAYRRLGVICMGLEGHHAKAGGYLRQAARMAGDLAEEFPDRVAYREEQFRATYEVGRHLWSWGRFDEAEGPLRQASSLAARLAADFPEVPAYQHNRADCLETLAELLYRAHPDDADTAYVESARIRRDLVKRFPNVPEYRYGLANTLVLRVGSLAAGGRLETPAACRQAQAELEEVQRLCLQMGGDPTRLVGVYIVRASLLMDLVQLQDAQEVLGQALEIRTRKHGEHPERSNWNGLAFALWKRGRLLALMGRPREAREAYLQAVDYQQGAVHALPGNACRRYELTLMLGELSWHCLFGPARDQDASKALRVVQEALKLAPDTAAYLRALQGLAYYRLGKPAEAITALEEARADLESPDRSQGWTKADDSILVQSARRKEGAAPGLILWLLAMSHHRQGTTTKATDYYQQAQRWQAQHRVPRHETAALKPNEAEAALARFFETERGDWDKLRQEVEALRQRAAGPPKQARPAGP
jgi:tetratricopeptide (TPR) repeat protein